MTQPPTPYPPNPPAGQPWSSPVVPAPRKSTGLIVLVIGLAAILVGIVGFMAGRLTAPAAITTAAASHTSAASSASSASSKATSAPTVSSTTARGFSLDGTTLTGWNATGSSFTTTLPTGWKIGNYNGGPNSGQILNATGDTIDYHPGFTGSAVNNCATQIATVKTGANESATDLPGHTWAGKAVTAVKITVHSNERNSMVVITYFCLDTTTGQSDLLRLISAAETNAAVMSAATSMMASWKWS